MVVQQLEMAQDQRRQELAIGFFGECTDDDYMVAESGVNGIVRIGNSVITKVCCGGKFRRPTFNVFRCSSIYGATYDRSIGSEKVTLHMASGDVTWSIYAANAFVLRLLGIIVGADEAAPLSEAMRRTSKKGALRGNAGWR